MPHFPTRAPLAALALAALVLAHPALGAEKPEDNLFLQENGARVAAFSSEFGSGWEASNLTPSRADFDGAGAPVRQFIWSSASMAPFPHWVTIRLDRPTWITTLVFDNFLAEEPDHPGISAREIEVWTGPDEASLTRRAAFELERNKAGQIVRIDPVEARAVKLVVKSNYGHPWYTELGATRAFDDGSRPQALDRVLADKGAVDLYGVYFDFGSARLRAESAPTLKEVAAWAKAHPGIGLVIEGHTDSVGADEANRTLSATRAEAVTRELKRLGVTTPLRAVGYGETRPVADNGSDEGRARNRRVTLRLEEKP